MKTIRQLAVRDGDGVSHRAGAAHDLDLGLLRKEGHHADEEHVSVLVVVTDAMESSPGFTTSGKSKATFELHLIDCRRFSSTRWGVAKLVRRLTLDQEIPRFES